MDKIEAIQDYLHKNDLEAFLVLTKINRQYVSGFTGSAGVVVVSKRGSALFVDDRYLIRARRESSFEVFPLDKLTTASLSSPLVRGERGGSKLPRVAIEDQITLRELKWLRKAVKAHFVPTKDVVENLRAVKTAQEIKYITRAQKIVDEIFFHIKKLLQKNSPFTPSLIKRGRGEFNEATISLEIERLAKRLGADGMAFESIVAFGANAAAPHHLSGSQKIKSRNFLLLDFGVLINGYHSDFTRTLFIGRPNKKQEKVYATVLEAQIRAIREIGEGKKAAMIDAAARRHIERAGFGKYFTHNTGHGVGLEIHELPNFSPKSEDILLKNMIVTVEPGIYIENWGGVRVEDMVLVSDKGPVLLSKSPKDLKSMIVK